MASTKREIADGFVLEHAQGRLEMHELAPGVLFQDYYGVVHDSYYEPVARFAEHRLSQGHRLTFLSDISRVNSSPTDYRRAWAEWFKAHDADIDGIIVLLGSTLGRMAVQTANLITGGSILAYSSREDFQAELERIVVEAWARAPVPDDQFTLGATAGASASTTDAGAPELDAFETGAFETGAFELDSGQTQQSLDMLETIAQSWGPDHELSGRLDRFVVRHKLGQGAMGVVYKCHDERLARDVAIKLLRHRVGTQSTRRLILEAQAMAQLNHPNVVSIHEIGDYEGLTFLVMEFVDGVTLRDWIEDGDYDIAELLQTFSGAGRGLAAAHAKGLVHRDFKPDNVMLSREGAVLVMDFGLACQDGSVFGPNAMFANSAIDDLRLTTTGKLVGTPAYMAPEQFLGQVSDARTDQFSFCVSLWEALYGQRPFNGKTLRAQSHAVRHKRPSADEELKLPRYIRRALERGLSPNPRNRWPSMDALLEVLAAPPKRWQWRRWSTARARARTER